LSTFIWEERDLKRWSKKTWCVIGAVLAAAALIAGLVVHITTVLSQQQVRKAHLEAVAQYRAA
jgi:hypothetical protein